MRIPPGKAFSPTNAAVRSKKYRLTGSPEAGANTKYRPASAGTEEAFWNQPIRSSNAAAERSRGIGGNDLIHDAPIPEKRSVSRAAAEDETTAGEGAAKKPQGRKDGEEIPQTTEPEG